MKMYCQKMTQLTKIRVFVSAKVSLKILDKINLRLGGDLMMSDLDQLLLKQRWLLWPWLLWPFTTQ